MSRNLPAVAVPTHGELYRSLFVTGVLFAIIGLTQLRLFWFLHVGWRYKSPYLLCMHFALSLFCILILFTLCIIVEFLDLYSVGPFRYLPFRNYFQAHILVTLCSLIPFLIGFTASWRYYCVLKKKMRGSEPAALQPTFTVYE